MKNRLYRVALISKDARRGAHKNLYRAIVSATSKEDALNKVELSLGKPLKDCGDGFVSVIETLGDVYTY